MRKRHSFTLAFIMVLFFATQASAVVKTILARDEKVLQNATEAKIFFTADVNTQTVTELAQAIDDLNNNYKALKKIYLYIDSYGGDMDSGYTGYWVVKSSSIPVTTVNLATTMSAATMIFCGAADRLSRRGGRFIMHPPSISTKDRYYQPDELKTAEQNLTGYVSMFAEVYAECTRYTGADIQTLLSSENDRKFLLPKEAQEKGIITGVADKIIKTPISYYILPAEFK